MVTDTNGVPISGVHVLIKGSQSGTFTNNDGAYVIDAHPTDVLVFSYIGFDPVEESVGDHTEINIALKESITDLGAVTVNAGYYKVMGREKTGNIAKVTAQELELQPVVSPLQALQGRVAGLEVVQRTGVPGMAPTLMIRGQNSFRNGFGNNGNLPLYIVDGVPIDPNPIITGGYADLSILTGIDPLNNISVANIESIEILKDADA